MGTRYGKRIVTDGLVLCLDAADNISAPHNDLPVKQGCLMWLDGADDSVFTYSSGTSVSEWRDKSGNNNHVSNSNGTYQPSRNVTINSKSAVNFSADSLTATNVFSSTATSYTKIAVVYQTSSGAGNVIGSNTGHTLWFQTSSYIKLYHSGNFVTSSISLPNNTAGIIAGTVQYNSSSSASGEVFVNGASGGTGTTSTASIGSTAVQIGSYNGANYFAGYIAEVLVYDRVLSSDELTKVNNYLQNKWNIPVSDGKWYDRTANGNNGTLTNDPTYSETDKGYFEFDGSDQYIDLGNLGLGSGSFTVEAVIYPTLASTYHVFFRKGDDSTSNDNMDWSMGYDYDQFHVRTQNASITVNEYAGGSFVNNYGHVALTYNGSTIRMYLNASQVSSKNVTLANNYSNYSIGRGINNYADLNVAIIRVYNQTLTAAEILQNYNATKERFNL